MGVKYSGKEKGKCSWSKCRKFKERWYYYFYLDVLVWICQRHLSEVIALSVMSLTHRGRQSRRDYIFGHSIITIRELLTLILAPNREQCFQTLPQSLLWIFHKTRMRYKQLFGVWVKKKHVVMSRFQTRETCFVPLSHLHALNDSSPVEPRYSRQCLIVIVALCIFSYLRQMAPFWLQKDFFYFIVCLFFTEFVKAAIHKSRWRSNIIWRDFQRLQ